MIATCCCILCVTLAGAQYDWEEENGSTSWQEPSTETTDAATSTYETSTSAEPDATYVIKKGDTLWDLAFQFLGDPFLWQQIWQANSYIANPDLIYPGNKLIIPGREPYPAAENNDRFTSETSEALSATDSLKDSTTDAEDFPSDSILLSLMRQKEVLSSGYLGAVPFLWFERDRKGNIYPGNATVNPPSLGSAYQLFTTLSFTPFEQGVYQENDTVSIFSSIRILRFNNKPANLIKRTGRAVIKKIGPRQIDALLFEISDAINGKERVMTIPGPQQQIIDTLIDPPAAISGEVFCRVEQTQTPYPFQMIILDVGSTQGVVIGDVFGIYHSDEKNPARLNVIGSIGHVGTGSSTLNMIIMRDNCVEEGDKAVLLRRARMKPPVSVGDASSTAR